MTESLWVSTVTCKGQVTIPVEIRRQLGIEPHSRVIFSVAGDQVVLSVAPETLASAYGAVEPSQRPTDFQAQRDQAIADKAARTAAEMAAKKARRDGGPQ